MFILHITSLTFKISIHLVQEAQKALLMAKKVIVSTAYSNYTNVFLEKSDVELLKQSNINKHATNLQLGK